MCMDSIHFLFFQLRFWEPLEDCVLVSAGIGLLLFSLFVYFSLDTVGNSLSALAWITSSGIYQMKIAPSDPTDTIVL